MPSRITATTTRKESAIAFLEMVSRGEVRPAYDRFIAPATRFAERVVTPPFGQSVVAIAKVPPR